MNRLEIETRFREENPEITANVISAAVLHSWCLLGDKEIAAKARLIVDTESITAVEDEDTYDLTAEIDNFYDIDELPGGGVTRIDDDGNEKRLIKTTKAELDDRIPGWRTASAGIPKYYFRRSKNMQVYPKPDDTIASFNVDCVLISDDFNNDNVLPFNQLTHLEPFHASLVFYLTWRAKAKVGKPDEATNALKILNDYIAWMRREIGGGKYGPISLRPTGLPSRGYQR